jgi:steroid delta-isomerase-like uncharacterized protein
MDNKTIARRFFELFSQGDLDTIEQELLSPDVVAHQPGMPEPLDRAGFRQVGEMFRTAFPDLRVTIEDQVAEGDTVATRSVLYGTHTGPLQGIPPTGRTVTISGINISRIVDGKIVERWDEFDQVGMLQQLGVMPAPAAA